MDGLGRKVVYFAAPASRDIGAAAEALGEIFFVREAFSPLPFVCVEPEQYLADYAARQAGRPAPEPFDEEDILVVAEGTLSPSEELEGWRMDLVARHRENPVIFLPQRVLYPTEGELTGGEEEAVARQRSALRRAKAAYGRHPDLRLFVRDEESLTRVKRLFRWADVRLCRDALFALPAEVRPRSREGVLFLVQELAAMPKEISVLEQYLNASWVTCREQELRAENVLETEEQKRQAADAVMGAIDKSRIVVTDSLFGVELARLLEVPSVSYCRLPKLLAADALMQDATKMSFEQIMDFCRTKITEKKRAEKLTGEKAQETAPTMSAQMLGALTASGTEHEDRRPFAETAEDSGAAKAPEVSILVPVDAQTGAEELARTLESITRQTSGSFELLVLVDGGASSLKEELARISDRRLQVVVSEEERGFARELSRGLGLAHGKFLAFAYPGDVWAPDRLARQLGYLAGHPAVDVLGCGWKGGPAEAEGFGEAPQTDFSLRCWLPAREVLPLSSVLLRRASARGLMLSFDGAMGLAAGWDLFTREAGKLVFHRLPEVLLTRAELPQGARQGFAEKAGKLRLHALRACFQDGPLPLEAFALLPQQKASALKCREALETLGELPLLHRTDDDMATAGEWQAVSFYLQHQLLRAIQQQEGEDRS